MGNLLPRLFNDILEHWKVKICCLCISIILFSYVQQSKQSLRTVDVQVDIATLPEELTFLKKPSAYIKVNFKGAKEMLYFDISDFRMLLENPSPKPGRNIYRAKLSPEAPNGIFVSYKEEQVIHLDRKIERTLPLQHNLQIIKETSSSDFELGYVRLNPLTITLVGPYETLSSMTLVRLKKDLISLQNEETYTKTTLIETLPDFVSPVSGEVIGIEVNVNILSKKERTYEKKLTLPVSCFNELKDLKLDIIGNKKVTIYFDGSANFEREKYLFKAFVYCPVFFNYETKNIVPSFIVSSQPIFIYKGDVPESTQVLKIDPPYMNLQFKEK